MNQNVDALKDIKASDFWYAYLDMMLVISPTLTNRERDVLATLLNYNYKEPAFPRGRATEVCKKLRMKPPQLSDIKDELIAKKWLVYEDGSLYLSRSLRGFQKFIQDKLKQGDCELMFTFPYKIVSDD